MEEVTKRMLPIAIVARTIRRVPIISDIPDLFLLSLRNEHIRDFDASELYIRGHLEVRFFDVDFEALSGFLLLYEIELHPLRDMFMTATTSHTSDMQNFSLQLIGGFSPSVCSN